MIKWKYWLTLAGWKTNAWFQSTSLSRIPILGSIWFRFKRLTARLLSSGQGVPVILDGEPINIHPFAIAYGIKSWEPYTTKLFKNALKPGSTVLDIGAHHGYFSLLAAKCVGKEGMVYAFEPAPHNFDILKKNAAFNDFDNLISVNKAVSNNCTTMPFYFRQVTGVVGSLFPTRRSDEMTIPVECITIDSFPCRKPVDVVKMDIEGGEPLALEGMAETLSKSENMVLFVEFNGGCLLQAGVDQETYLAQLDKAGFECQVINEEMGCLEPIEPNLESCNLYCTKKISTK